MAWIFVDKESEGGQSGMRSQMRQNMRRGGYRMYGGSMRDGGSYRDGYKDGYEHGWKDSEDDMSEENYRRGRDSMGRYM